MCPQSKIVAFVRRQLREIHIVSNFLKTLFSYIFGMPNIQERIFSGKGPASLTGLQRNFILLSVIFRAKLNVLASKFNLDD